MNDARTRWYDKEIIEGTLSPLQELESLFVSLKLQLLILLNSIKLSGNINLN